MRVLILSRSFFDRWAVSICLTAGRSAAAGSAGRPLHRLVSCLPRLGRFSFIRLMYGVDPGARRGGSVKHALDADVLINVPPVDALSRPDQPEVKCPPLCGAPHSRGYAEVGTMRSCVGGAR